VHIEGNPELTAGICQFRPQGTCTLVEVVDIIRWAIGYCRDRAIDKLLFDARGLSGISMPTLVDRFLMAEDWAQEAKGMVTVVLAVHEEYIHPEKFGVKVAAAFGLTLNVFSSYEDALKWLSSVESLGRG